MPVRSDLTLDDEALAGAAEGLLAATTTDWEDAFARRLEQKAHHLTRIALAHIPLERRDTLERERAEHLRRAQRALREHQEHTRKQLDAALRDQVLTDSDRAALLIQLQGIDLGSEDVTGQQDTLKRVSQRIGDAQHARSEELRAEVAGQALEDEDRTRINRCWPRASWRSLQSISRGCTPAKPAAPTAPNRA